VSKKLLFWIPLALLLMGSTYDPGANFAADSVAVVNSVGTFRATLSQPTVLTANRGIAVQDAAMEIPTTVETTAITGSATTHSDLVAQDITDIGNLSGTNTGDQTITLTGDVTGSGTGSFAATITDNAVGLDELAGGTDGNLITYDASGDPAHVATGTANQVLTSNGAGAAPTMQDISGASMHQVLTDGTTITWDQSLGTFATLTLTDAVGTRTLNITNDVVGQSFLILIQDSTDGLELIATWDASIKWTVGIDPTLSEGLSEEDVVVLFSDGTTQYGFTGYDYQ